MGGVCAALPVPQRVTSGDAPGQGSGPVFSFAARPDGSEHARNWKLQSWRLVGGGVLLDGRDVLFDQVVDLNAPIPLLHVP